MLAWLSVWNEEVICCCCCFCLVSELSFLNVQLNRSILLTVRIFAEYSITDGLPSVLWQCWLYVRKSVRPVKNEWLSVWSEVQMICIMVQLMLLPPHHPLLRYNPDWLNSFLVPGYFCPRKESIKRISAKMNIFELIRQIIEPLCKSLARIVIFVRLGSIVVC